MRLLIFISFLFFCLSCLKQPVAEQVREVASEEQLITTCDYSKLSDSMRSPKTIDEVTDLINSLPKPLSLACLVKSLKRPLKINMTLSRLSAQPAVGTDSPRIFIFLDDLILSIAPAGKGADLLELSEMYSDKLSLKSELKFPIKEQITYQTGFDRISLGDKTTCRACHNNESLDNTGGKVNAYTSVALKPESKFSLASFRQEVYQCELQEKLDYRCQLILAVAFGNSMIDTDFPSATPTWIESIL